MLKEKGFSLIELIVVISVMSVILVSTTVYVGNFNSRQKIDTTKDELLSRLRLARNYAIAMRKPDGVSDLEYIELRLAADGQVSVLANGVSEFFEVDVAPDGVVINTPISVLFSVYEGKLLKIDGGNLVLREPDERITLSIGSNEGIGDTKLIIIDPSGLINE